jgi:protein regulator of cytokinesis 1
MDFYQIVTDVHPSLDDSNGGQSKSISNDTLDRLAKTIRSLQDEKKKRIKKVRFLNELSR